MRAFFSLFCILLSLCPPRLRAESGNFLNVAIMTLPPKVLADVPLSEREALLLQASDSAFDRRLDYPHGYLDWHSDAEEGPHASSVFCLKILPENEFGSAVFVHLWRPFNGLKPSPQDTFIMEKDGDAWKDVTEKLLPKGVDRRSHFRPLRGSSDIEVAPWVRSGSKGGYSFGKCIALLRWQDGRFRKIAVSPRPLTEEN